MRAIVRMAQGLFRLAGRDDLAERFRPILRRLTPISGPPGRKALSCAAIRNASLLYSSDRPATAAEAARRPSGRHQSSFSELTE